ncbi:O-antigen ligase family protein [Williamsia limnetica]|uniref:O-antigen ligase family protein n=1 Tax=Williamsia limnetica TaxID=882452 RepID=UPI0013147392|nr:O-antigen ligase family protein [Williamsia limnetica]
MSIAVLWALSVDTLTMVDLGPLSLSGLATLGVSVALLVVSIGVYLVRDDIPPIGFSYRFEPYLADRYHGSKLPWPFVVFLTVTACGLVLAPSPDGLQNLAVYAMFGLAIPVAAAYCSAGSADRTLLWLRNAGLVVGGVTAAQSITGVDVYGPRSAALVLVVCIAVTLARPKVSLFDWVLPLLLFVSCALTLSRTALFVAAILFPISLLFTAGRNGLVKLVAVAVPVYTIMYFLVTNWAPLRNRFTEGDSAYAVGGIDLNTSGRAVLWRMTIDSWRESPLFGQGAGSASAMISSRFSNKISHPHNDYLRILHDFGIVGFIPFVIALVWLVALVTKRARTLRHPIHRGAALAIIAVVIIALTDNVFVYPFVMLPVGVLVGLSLAYTLRGSVGRQRAVAVAETGKWGSG